MSAASNGALGAAILEAQAACLGVDKGSTNSHQKYKYTSVEQMVATVRGPLRAAGRAVFRLARR